MIQLRGKKKFLEEVISNKLLTIKERHITINASSKMNLFTTRTDQRGISPYSINQKGKEKHISINWGLMIH